LPTIADCIVVESSDDHEQLRANVLRAVNEALRTRHRTATQADLAFAAGEVVVEERRDGRVRARGDHG
jgi:hypothetical protein